MGCQGGQIAGKSVDHFQRESEEMFFFRLNKDRLVGGFLPHLLWQRDMTLLFLCRDAGADGDDDEISVISRLPKCDTLFTTV